MKKILLGLMALSLMATAPVFASSHCDCDSACRKACAEGKASTCTCEHCDCGDCKCNHE